MSYLLDTHVFIWFINGQASLPKEVRNKIKNLKNSCYISIASIWEIAIKIKLKKLNIAASFSQIQHFMTVNQIEVLPITFEHIEVLHQLELHHRDPFDRIIIAQCMSEELTIFTKDQNFNSYPIKIKWQN